jgi:hypothetical protein
MMRTRAFWQYVLVAGAWLIAIVSMPLAGAELNGFLMWRGETDTAGLVRWLFSLPRMVANEWSDPGVKAGVRAGGRVAASTFAFGDLMWLALVLLGFVLFLFAPVMVRRRNLSGPVGRTVIRCVAPVLLVFPATCFAPALWHFPVPRVGMMLLGAAHVMIFVMMFLSGSERAAETAFPVLTGRE